MYDLNKNCFMCLNANINLKAVFDTDTPNNTAVQVKYTLPELTIFNPQIPVNICSLCCTSLNSFYAFKKMCLENYNRLLDNIKISQGTSDSQNELVQLQIKQEQENELIIKEENEEQSGSVVEDESMASEEDYQQLEFVKCEAVSDSDEEGGSSVNNLVPEKSKRQYEKTYDEFNTWRRNKNVKKVSENILLEYLEEKSKTVKSSTLWSICSMLKCMLNVREGIDIKNFSKLIPFLKKTSVGYRPKKSKALTREQINLFLTNACDETYLMWKVVLIMGISGGLQREELTKMTIDNIQDVSSALIVRVPDNKTDTDRTFIVSKPEFIELYRKYVALRPTNVANRRVFLRYQNGKCTPQVVGIHTIGKIPFLIAKYLGLPNSEAYTGHCFRRSSATLFPNGGRRYKCS